MLSKKSDDKHLPLPATESRIPEESHGRRHRKRVLALFLGLMLVSYMLLTPAAYPAIGRGRHSSQRLSHKTIDERVNEILRKTPLIDGHNDFAIYIRYKYENHINDKGFREGFESSGLPLHVDRPRLRAGKNGGAFWSVFVPCPDNGTDFSDQNYATSVQATLQQIDVVTRLTEAYPGDFSSVLVNSSDALAAFKQGKLISPMGIEGLHQIGNSVANLRRFHSMGVRYATLTHNCHNRYADAALLESPLRVAEPRWNGVSPEGRRVVAEMNRLGLIVDLSHVSEATMVDVLGGGQGGWEGSRAPVIFSHSSAHALCPHPRNVKDSVLRLVKRCDSLVMVNFSPDFVSCTAAKDGSGNNGLPDFYPANSTLAHVADHIMHIGDLIGFDHVGLGSDFDGIQTTPRGLEDVSKFPDLVSELLRRGVSDEDAAKVVGGNLLRVWREVDAAAQRLQAEGELPLEDDLSPALGSSGAAAKFVDV
ncbi:hypothetical protein RB597_007437 [Gaeumannomyces tritici]